MSENLPKIAANQPYKIEVKAGQKYFWCSCGLSNKQPFCDGAHKGSGMKSVVFEASEDKEIYFCGCKQSKNGMFCDGSHSQLS